MDKRITAVLQVGKGFGLFIAAISIRYCRNHDLGWVFPGGGAASSNSTLSWVKTTWVYKRCISGVESQGFSREKVATLIFLPRIFSVGKWKTGKCREFQESKGSGWCSDPQPCQAPFSRFSDMALACRTPSFKSYLDLNTYLHIVITFKAEFFSYKDPGILIA